MIDISLPIIGKAIVIREMRDEDIELLYDLETDNEVKRYVGGGTLSRPKQDWIERMRQLRVEYAAQAVKDASRRSFAPSPSVGPRQN